jgi:hypothetical protein
MTDDQIDAASVAGARNEIMHLRRCLDGALGELHTTRAELALARAALDPMLDFTDAYPVLRDRAVWAAAMFTAADDYRRRTGKSESCAVPP